MKTIFKLGNSLYLEGLYKMRNEAENWASPVDCPTIFEAYGQAIQSGNWQSCTAINTANYVIDNYLNSNIYKYMPSLSNEDKRRFWELAKEIEFNNNWKNKDVLLPLIQEANQIILKLNSF